jgi:hypothetical protein
MKTLSEQQLDVILKKIKQHKQQHKKLDEALNTLGTGSLLIDYGGGILDSLIGLLELIFDDTENIIEWYIFENEFGEKNFTKKMKGKEITIKTTQDLLICLTKK